MKACTQNSLPRSGRIERIYYGVPKRQLRASTAQERRSVQWLYSAGSVPGRYRRRRPTVVRRPREARIPCFMHTQKLIWRETTQVPALRCGWSFFLFLSTLRVWINVRAKVQDAEHCGRRRVCAPKVYRMHAHKASMVHISMHVYTTQRVCESYAGTWEPSKTLFVCAQNMMYLYYRRTYMHIHMHACTHAQTSTWRNASLQQTNK
jgi:hypothetical protein